VTAATFGGALQRLAMTNVQAYTVDGFCRAFGIGKTHLYKEINSGRLVALKSGSRTVIPAHAAKDWLESLPALSPKPCGLEVAK
jgi:excisionase family DNA binding protein